MESTRISIIEPPGRKRWLFASLRGWQPSWLPADAVAGLMLMAIVLPGQLAAARLAGLPALARLEASRAAAAAQRSGLLDALGADHVFHSVEEAVRSGTNRGSP